MSEFPYIDDSRKMYMDSPLELSFHSPKYRLISVRAMLRLTRHIAIPSLFRNVNIKNPLHR